MIKFSYGQKLPLWCGDITRVIQINLILFYIECIFSSETHYNENPGSILKINYTSSTYLVLMHF